MLGINTRLQKIDDSVAVHLRLGYLHSDMDFSVIETFTSTKPGGTIKINDDVNGYYIGLSVPITIDENIRVVGSFTNMQRERLFKGSSRPFTFDQSLIEFSGQFLF